ncbi:MAG: hypothetical protein V7K68_03650 [Nostoc sp.]|uniref:hypothetical protein n=1 Tax=Nostoc sp. TaxID=1180 RepID=UPI002FFA3F46
MRQLPTGTTLEVAPNHPLLHPAFFKCGCSTVHGWEPNPDLRPETGSTWSAGVDVNFSQNLIGQFTLVVV